MKLTEQQRERLWHIMKGAGCSDEWLMQKGEYLCDNIASLIERPAPTPVVIHQDSPSYRPSSGFDATSFVTGMIVGDMFGG